VLALPAPVCLAAAIAKHLAVHRHRASGSLRYEWTTFPMALCPGKGFMRLALGFSKSLDNLKAAVAVYVGKCDLLQAETDSRQARGS
jgi:hypothetical protein